jgi:hypothetical protein
MSKIVALGRGEQRSPMRIRSPQEMVALRHVLAHESEIGRENGPFLVRHIGGVGCAKGGFMHQMVRHVTLKVLTRLLLLQLQIAASVGYHGAPMKAGKMAQVEARLIQAWGDELETVDRWTG